MVGPWPLTFMADWAWASAHHGHVIGVNSGARAVVWPVQTGDGQQIDGVDLDALALRPSRLFGAVQRLSRRRRFLALLDDIEQATGPVDVVHTHFASATAGLETIERSWRWVHTEHASSILGRTASPSGLRAAARVFRAADQLTFVSPSLRRAAAAATGTAEVAGAVVLPNPVRIRGPVASDAPDSLRLLSVGSLIDRKRFHLSVEALARLRVDRSDARLSIIGDGPELPHLVQLADRLGVGDHVDFLGRQDRDSVFDAMRSSSVLLHPSATETYGVVMAEALLVGRPVVAMRSGGLTDDPPPFLDVVTSLDEIVRTIGALASSPPAPGSVAAAARRHVSATATAAMLGELYTGPPAGETGRR